MTQTRLSTLHIVLDLRYLPKPLIKNHKKKYTQSIGVVIKITFYIFIVDHRSFYIHDGILVLCSQDKTRRRMEFRNRA